MVRYWVLLVVALLALLSSPGWCEAADLSAIWTSEQHVMGHHTIAFSGLVTNASPNAQDGLVWVSEHDASGNAIQLLGWAWPDPLGQWSFVESGIFLTPGATIICWWGRSSTFDHGSCEPEYIPPSM